MFYGGWMLESLPNPAPASGRASVGDDGRGVANVHFRSASTMVRRETLVSRRARPDPRLRQPTSSKWLEFEDTSTLGGLHRIVEIDLIEGADEPDPERYASGERTKDVAKERDSLCRVQLGRSYFFFPAAHDDGRAAGSAQVAYPLDVAPEGLDPTPA
jgi:hypothetical protein